MEAGRVTIDGTETVLLSLDREVADQRFVLRRAYLTGMTIRSALVKCSSPVRVIDYSETFHDDCIEIAISVTAAPDGCSH